MRKEILEFKQKHGRALSLIVAHFIQIGAKRSAVITDEEIAKIRARLEQEEKEAEANGKIQIMTADFQCYLLEACRDLAKLSENQELIGDVNLLIAQSLCSDEVLIANMEYSTIQRTYWEQVITQYIESWSDDEEREEFEKLLEEDGMEEVIDRLLNDDETWDTIDQSIEYFITHLK